MTIKTALLVPLMTTLLPLAIAQETFAEDDTPLTISVSKFTADTAAEFTLHGQATVVSDELRLTEAKPWNHGVALFNSAQDFGPERSFSALLSFRMPDPSCDQGLGADGLAFTIQHTLQKKGVAGNGVGYAGAEDTVTIEFDTFFNGEYKDPVEQHIGLSLHGDPSSYATAPSPYPLNDGRTYHSWIEYNGAKKVLEVRLSHTTTRPAEATLSSQVDLSTVLKEEGAYVGVAASTGKCVEQHLVKSLYFTNRFVEGGITPPSS